MDDGLLSLKWNNHTTTFQYILSRLRDKPCHSDVTLACCGNLYPAHKLVLSSCSTYFSNIFESTRCHSPVIVLKDINKEDLEALLDYMYVGLVDVKQSSLSSLIKAAECLQIKGLAGPDEDPYNNVHASYSKEVRHCEDISSAPKRRKIVSTDSIKCNSNSSSSNSIKSTSNDINSNDGSSDSSKNLSEGTSSSHNVPSKDETRGVLPTDMIKVEMEDQSAVDGNDRQQHQDKASYQTDYNDLMVEKTELYDGCPSSLHEDDRDESAVLMDNKELVSKYFKFIFLLNLL